MTTIIASEDCGNSPKNIFLHNLTVAFAQGDTAIILSSVSEDILWEIVGQKRVQGKSAFAEALQQANAAKVAQVTIQHVVSHGKAGAVNGVTVLESGKTRAFCDVYEFSNAKGSSVRAITSYVLDIG